MTNRRTISGDLSPNRSAPIQRQTLGLKDRVQKYAVSLKGQLLQPAIIAVLGVVLGFNVLVRAEWLQQTAPQIQWAELGFHRFLCSLAPRSLTPKWVRTVEIDDAAHRELGEPTSRAFLANLVSKAVEGDAAVIVLDIKLLAPEGMAAGLDDDKRSTDNAILLSAVRAAAASGVPVVLTSWLKESDDGTFRPRSSIYLDGDLPLPDRNGQCSRSRFENAIGHGQAKYRLPTCVRIGNINLPTDKRQIPLVTLTADSDVPSESLALAATSAYEEAIDRKPRTRDKQRILSAVSRDEFVFASFIPESEFQKIPIRQLAEGLEDALRLCRGRIIVIGGNWHADLGHGERIDTYKTPVGPMAGMYLHANYIEALLDDRYQREVPIWVALIFDLVVGAWLYIRFHKAKGDWVAQLGVLVIPAFLLVSSYVIFSNLNLYLDFVLPLGACFVHLGVEHLRNYRRMWKGFYAQSVMPQEVQHD